jgi:lipoprotein-releasing system permease protein
MENTRNKSKAWLALKYLRGQSPRPINRSHYLTIAGIILGVTALICVGTVMNGLRADIRDRIVGTLSEIRISKEDGSAFGNYSPVLHDLEKDGFTAAPVVRNELVLKKGDQIVTTICFGIDAKAHSRISKAIQPSGDTFGTDSQGLLTGSVLTPGFAAGGIALGAGLASTLDLKPGDEIQLLSPLFSVPTAFGLLPKVRTLTVSAIFSAGMPEYDETFSFVPLPVGQFFSGYTDEVDYIEVKTPSFDRTAVYTRQIRSMLPGYQVEDWGAYDANLYSAIRFEKYLMFLIMLFMYIIASFNLTGNMLKTISQKKRELGLLKAFGYHEKDLRDLFLYQSLILSTIGIIAGCIIATTLLLIQQRFGLISLDMGTAGPMPLPVKFSGLDYLTVILASYLITFLSVLFPLKRLRQINPIELIRQTT